MVYKTHLIELLVKRGVFPSKVKAHKALDGILDTMTQLLQEEHDVNLKGFGTFKTKNVKGRDYKNPRTGETVAVPDRKRVTFKQGKLLGEFVNK